MISKATLKFVHSLKQKKFRLQNKAFVAEGNKLVPELLNSRIRLRSIFATDEGLKEYAALLQQSEAEVVPVSKAEMQRLSFLKSPRDLLAVCEIPDESSALPESGRWSFYLDDIRDPGNLGTIVRTADWFGLKRIFCSADTAELYNPKVVQASMGSIARVELIRIPFESIRGRIPCYAAMMQGMPVKELGASTPGLVVIGNEGQGISAGIVSQCRAFTIPGQGGAESLNASVAAGIIMAFLQNPC